LFAHDEGEWAVELGPIASQRFRDDAVETLLRLGLADLDREQTAKLLQSSRIRLGEGLSKGAAEALVEAIGRRETQASTVSGPRGRVGWGGFANRGLPLVGVALGIGLALAWSPVGLVLGLALAAGLGVAGTARPRPILTSFPPMPLLPDQVDGLVERLFAAAQELEDTDRERLLEVGRAALTLLERLSDDDNMAARIAGGPSGQLGKATIAALEETVRLAGTTAGNEVSSTSMQDQLAGIAQAVESAVAGLDAIARIGDDEEPAGLGACRA
jgi:hypothetical protein